MVLPERAQVIENRIDVGDSQAEHRRVATQYFFVLENQRNGQDRPNGAAFDAQQHLKRGTAAGTKSGYEDVCVKNDPVDHIVSYMILPESAIPVGMTPNAQVELQGDQIRERAERAQSIAALSAPTNVRQQAHRCLPYPGANYINGNPSHRMYDGENWIHDHVATLYSDQPCLGVMLASVYPIAKEASKGQKADAGHLELPRSIHGHPRYHSQRQSRSAEPN